MSILLVAVILIFVFVAVFAGVIVATLSRAASGGPRCGNCRYDLTGAVSNRCPECGKLFIEAGVVTPRGSETVRRRRALLISAAGVACAMALVLVTVALFATRAAHEARRAATAQALAAQREAEVAAVAQFQAKMLADLDVSKAGGALSAAAIAASQPAVSTSQATEK